MDNLKKIKLGIGRPAGFPDLDDETGEPVDKKPFEITNDGLADWAIRTIQADEEEYDRLIEDIKEEIVLLEERIAEEEKKKERKTSFLKFHLRKYFATVPRKVTKTQESYKLPSGNLVFRKGGYAYDTDNDKLCDWLLKSNKSQFVKTVKKADWAELKKSCTVEVVPSLDADGNIISGLDTYVVKDEKGNKVEGITVSRKPDTFDIK